jgi:dipeptidase D
MMDWLHWEPKAFYRFFEQISDIPRGSYNEEGIADFLCAFAQARGLSYKRDAVHNVIIDKPAHADAAGKPGVLLQGHSDMVCEKNAATVHDFEKDPIKLVLDGDVLRASGTTLGADNGVAVALMLAVLDDKALVHPKVQCLFTSQEEVGLIGAHELDPAWIDSDTKTMVNLDSGPEDTAIVSCAGGMRIDVEKRFAPTAAAGTALKLSVTGLMGGHSGTSINRHRANANKLMGRILNALPSFCLASIDGGSKENAIPRECFAVVTTDDKTALTDAANLMAEVIRAELSPADEGFAFSIEPAAGVEVHMSAQDTRAIVSLLMIAPNGVLSMSHGMEGLVETSVNLGVVKTEGNAVTLTFAPRSSVESKQDETEARIRLLGEAFSCNVRSYNRYPGWRYNPDSAARTLLQEVYRDLFGGEIKVEAIHAGLECGILLSKAPHLDVIATGAETHDVHTPDEWLLLPSVERVWKLLTAFLGRLAS